MRQFLNFGILFILISCSTMKSGTYIKIRPGETVASLSKLYHVPSSVLLGSNKGRSPAVDQWYFIPNRSGFIGKDSFRGSVDYTPNYLVSSDFVWPVPSSKRISSGFGKRWGNFHNGIDIPAKKGTSIVAVADGEVIYSGKGLRGFGNLTVISHADGIFSVYAHAQKNYSKKGDRVYKGEVIARVGSTGRSTGPHLHFEMRRNSKALNPLKLVSNK